MRATILAAMLLAGCAAAEPPAPELERPVAQWTDPLADCPRASIRWERAEIDPKFQLRAWPLDVIEYPVCAD